eukprot:303276_1
MIQSLFCVMDDIEINIFNHSFDTSVSSFWPELKSIRNRLPNQYNYNDTICGEYGVDTPWHRPVAENGWGEAVTAGMIRPHRQGKNVKLCTTKMLHAEYSDKSNLYFHFNHNQW